MKAKNIIKIVENPITQLLIGILVVVFICYRCGVVSLLNNERTPEEAEKARIGIVVSSAYDAAKQEMKLQLKSPSTAEFPSPYDEGPKCKVNDNGSVIIQSFVDSQNSFGATIRTNFRCTVNQAGKVSDLVTW